VSEQFLCQAGIEKGVMTLIGDERRAALLRALVEPPVASSSGGSAANTLIGVAGCGGSAYLACRLGQDEWGDFYQRDLERMGVRSSAGERARGSTGQCLVFITPDADRTMNTCLGVSSSLGPEQIEEQVVAASRYVYLEGYLVATDAGFAACLRAQELARRHAAAVALTLSDPQLVHGYRSRLQQLVDGGVALLLCNEDEARAFTGRADRTAAGRELMRATRVACITCGPEGALVCADGATTTVPGTTAQVVDTTGAGDMFAAGVLYGLANGCGLAPAAWLGNCAAAQVVARYGARLERPLRDQVPGILSRCPAT
jgi:sugar/nucleoside kinase (ribokinase family)